MHSSKSASNIVADRWEGGELYKDVCADSAAATFVADPQDCETSTWYSAPVANIDEGESCDRALVELLRDHEQGVSIRIAMEACGQLVKCVCV